MSRTSNDRGDGFGCLPFAIAVLIAWVVLLTIDTQRSLKRLDRIEKHLGIAEQQEQGK